MTQTARERDGADDHSAPTWENQRWHARRLLQEKGYNALWNPHGMIGRECGCMECFCCAAYVTVQDHDRDGAIRRRERRARA